MKLNGAGTLSLPFTVTPAIKQERRYTLRGDPDYISESEKAELIEKARIARNKQPKPKSLLTFPGFKGEPSVLPGMGNAKRKPVK